MRYADHVASGYGIVWNVSEAPVDGATDFLFMLAVAALRCIGFSLELGVRLLTVFSHVATVILIFLGMQRVQGASFLPAWLTAAYFATGPGFYLSAAYFGTPMFVLFLAGSWLLAQRLLSQDMLTTKNQILFSFACLLTGLVRPEGVLLSVFMLFAVGTLVSAVYFRRLLFIFCMIFLVVGGAYFLWHWHYFGYPLPNPYYKKGGWHLYPDSLRDSFRISLDLLLPILPVFLLALCSRKALRMATAFMMPVIGSVVIWALLSKEMNFGGRFQYPTFVLGLLSWFPLIRKTGVYVKMKEYAVRHRVVRLLYCSLVLIITGVFFLREFYHVSKISYKKDIRYDMAKVLHEYVDEGYTLATTEAGILPLYSGWRAVDTWGLNDAWIAHHNGVITELYLENQRPDLVIYHMSKYSEDENASGINNAEWSQQILVLKNYVSEHDFILAAVMGDAAQDGYFYYVRPDLPDSAEIIRRIRNAVR